MPDMHARLARIIVRQVVDGEAKWHPKDAIDMAVLIVVEERARVADRNDARLVAAEIRRLAFRASPETPRGEE